MRRRRRRNKFLKCQQYKPAILDKFVVLFIVGESPGSSSLSITEVFSNSIMWLCILGCGAPLFLFLFALLVAIFLCLWSVMQPLFLNLKFLIPRPLREKNALFAELHFLIADRDLSNVEYFWKILPCFQNSDLWENRFLSTYKRNTDIHILHQAKTCKNKHVFAIAPKRKPATASLIRAIDETILYVLLSHDDNINYFLLIKSP